MSIRGAAAFAALLVSALIAGSPAALAAPGAEEMRCRSMVDGRVAWNQQGDTAWQPQNIEALCAGATDADARIACFEAGIASHGDWSQAIAACAGADGASPAPGGMEPSEPAPPPTPPAGNGQSEEMRCRGMVDGRVAWNQQGDTAWQPGNIEALCAGATDADERIACFEAGIASHGDWSRAIAECAGAAPPTDMQPPPGAPPAPPEPAGPPPSEPEPTAPPSSGPEPTPPNGGEPGQTDESTFCKNLFQDKVPTSLPATPNNRHWEQSDLDKICNGTVNATETLKCYLRTLYNHGNPVSGSVAIEGCRSK